MQARPGYCRSLVGDHDLVEGLVGYPQRLPLGAFLETDRPDFISVVRHLALQLRMPRRQSDNDLVKVAGRKSPCESQREFSPLPAPIIHSHSDDRRRPRSPGPHSALFGVLWNLASRSRCGKTLIYKRRGFTPATATSPLMATRFGAPSTKSCATKSSGAGLRTIALLYRLSSRADAQTRTTFGGYSRSWMDRK